ncbi:hypothetical protein GCM10010116_55960 [Microbispora rosea subsp. aerata]|nr:hypothetical protein [Microbispora rosea]GGO27917.1 hypothetical protein GCM10010116_55960 [Microbispora rosea subsp. aerata]GIH56978.1 hypothetical protein Mro02_38920 [Microbispora rosea subsp. aerata]GLJ82905.1 hypothetical protein GCM10017588_16310 [Microbispora rosea subsp. aerata]
MTRVIGPDDELEPGWAEAASLPEVSALAGAGHTVVVTLPEDETEAIAAAAAYAWAGASVFRTSHDVRQALDMTESLLGRRPPALTRRGLA